MAHKTIKHIALAIALTTVSAFAMAQAVAPAPTPVPAEQATMMHAPAAKPHHAKAKHKKSAMHHAKKKSMHHHAKGKKSHAHKMHHAASGAAQ